MTYSVYIKGRESCQSHLQSRFQSSKLVTHSSSKVHCRPRLEERRAEDVDTTAETRVGNKNRSTMITTHNAHTDADLVTMFQMWWPNRHGVNAGAIRDILHNYINSMRQRQ